MGEQLTKILEDIEKGRVTKVTDNAIIDLGISTLPVLSRDNTDRNRTSPFAFTGNKFEFRAVGSSQSISFPTTVINTIVAESLDELAEKIKAKKAKNINQAVFDVLREEIREIKPVLFNGDNYSEEWAKEAKRRGLPNAKTTPEALEALITEKALNLFSRYGVLSPVELKSRYLIHLERYVKDMEIDVKCMHNLIMGHVIPAGVNYVQRIGEAILKIREILGTKKEAAGLEELLTKVSSLVDRCIKTDQAMMEGLSKAASIEDERKRAFFLCEKVKSRMDELRTWADELETLVPDDLWTLPKFWEMLFIS